MIDAIKQFFSGHLTPVEHAEESTDPERLRLAACALLVELAWVDGIFEEAERRQLRDSLIARMGLARESAEELIALAEAERSSAVDYFQFTSLVAGHFSLREKHLLLEVMWEVVLADGTISRSEDHLIRRVAPLLGLDTRSVPDAKARVQERQRRSPGDSNV